MVSEKSDTPPPRDGILNPDLESLLQTLRDERFIYIPNPGNAGDSFIAHATYQLFSRLGLNYEIGNQLGTYSDRVIVFAGGGNLVLPYSGGVDFLHRNLGTWSKLIILPHTIRAYEDLLSRLDKNCYLFCRETSSYNFVNTHAKTAKVFLAHDLAFSCDFISTRAQMQTHWLTDLLNRKLLIRNLKRLFRSIYHGRGICGRLTELNAFRTDIERTVVDIPPNNFDISQGYSADDMLPLSSLHATYWMMTFIDRFSVVRTNRLHVGIMSAMLGKELHLYDNSYGKVYDIFSHSMRDRFPRIQWKGSAAPASDSIQLSLDKLGTRYEKDGAVG